MGVFNPTITVLMTVYNGGKYLSAAIQSILNQTLRDFEFLIIDDGSTDNSIQTIESFGDGRIRLYRNSVNLGQTKSLNVGLKMAQGDYIARIDADDIALSYWLEKQAAFIKNNPDYSVVGVYVVAIDEMDRIKKIYRPPMNQEDIVLRSLIASPVNHVGAVLKKEDVLSQGGYGENYKTAADYDLWGKLLRGNRKMTTNPQILMAIREHAKSLSRSERGKKELQEIIEVTKKNIDKFTNIKFSDDEVKLFCMANYDEGNLGADEFNKALKATRKVYRNLEPSLRIENKKAARWLYKRCTTIYLKRLFFFLMQKNYAGARRLSLEGIKEFGFSIFVPLFIASLSGKMFSQNFLALYEKMLRKKAQLQISGRLNMGLFH